MELFTARHRPLRFGLASLIGLGLACAGGEERGICEVLADPPEKVGSPVELRFINDGTEAVFIREVYACTDQWFELSQGDEILAEGPGGCDTCKEILEEGDCGGCVQVACKGLSFVRIEPGATFTVAWPGVLYEEVEWPMECAYDATSCFMAPASCVAPKAAEGAFSVRVVQAFEVSMCGGGPCECTNGAETCEVGTDMYGSFKDVIMPLNLPQDDVLEFHLQ